MDNEFPTEKFPTSEELIKNLREKSDDFDLVKIMVVNDLPIKGPEQQVVIARNCCAIIKKCNGESVMIHRDELQTLLNDGILQRLKIPIELVPAELR